METRATLGVTSPINNCIEWDSGEFVPEISELSHIALVVIVQEESADSKPGNERIMIGGCEPRSCLIKAETFHLREERSTSIGKITSDDQTGRAYSIEVLGPLDEITRTRAPNPPMFYKITRFAVGILQPLNQLCANKIVGVEFHHIPGVPCSLRVLPGGPNFCQFVEF